MAGIGGVWQHVQGGIPADTVAYDGGRQLVTLEANGTERLAEILERCESVGGTAWVQLRDPYNWLASLHRGIVDLAVAWRPDRPLEIWKTYGRCCLGRTWLQYNRWFRDPIYRRELAEQFGFRRLRDGEAWEEIPSRGGGSSFDKQTYAGRAQEMAVDERYRRYMDKSWWRDQFDDEVVELAERLFGIARPW